MAPARRSVSLCATFIVSYRGSSSPIPTTTCGRFAITSVQLRLSLAISVTPAASGTGRARCQKAGARPALWLGKHKIALCQGSISLHLGQKYPSCLIATEPFEFRWWSGGGSNIWLKIPWIGDPGFRSRMVAPIVAPMPSSLLTCSRRTRRYPSVTICRASFNLAQHRCASGHGDPTNDPGQAELRKGGHTMAVSRSTASANISSRLDRCRPEEGIDSHTCVATYQAQDWPCRTAVQKSRSAPRR